MRFEQRYLLDRAGVDEAARTIGNWLKDAGQKKDNVLRLRLAMEEVLLNLCEHYGGTKEIRLVIRQRFGTPSLRIRYEGERYDPTPSGETSGESSGDEWTRNMLRNLGLEPVWTYRNGINEVSLRGPGKSSGSQMLMAAAIVLSIAAGLARNWLPASFVTAAGELALTPVADAFMGTLKTFVGILVFLAMITGIWSMGNIAEFGRMGRYCIGHLILKTLGGTAFFALAALPFFALKAGRTAGGGASVGTLVELLFGIFPSDPVTPFAQGNMLQIIFMAVLIGCGVLVLNDQLDAVRTITYQLYTLISTVTQGICRFLPIYIFASLTVILWENGMDFMLRLWKPLVVFLVICFLAWAAMTFWVSFRLHLSPGKVILAINPSMMIALATASSTAAFGTILDVNENRLGISRKLSRFGTVLANQFYALTLGGVLMVTLYFLAEHFKVPIDPGWVIIAIFMSAIFSITCPPISGGMLIVLGLLMAQLNLPKEGATMVAILLIVLDFPATSMKVGLTHVELLRQAAHLDMWERDRFLS